MPRHNVFWCFRPMLLFFFRSQFPSLQKCGWLIQYVVQVFHGNKQFLWSSGVHSVRDKTTLWFSSQIRKNNGQNRQKSYLNLTVRCYLINSQTYKITHTCFAQYMCWRTSECLNYLNVTILCVLSNAMIWWSYHQLVNSVHLHFPCLSWVTRTFWLWGDRVLLVQSH